MLKDHSEQCFNHIILMLMKTYFYSIKMQTLFRDSVQLKVQVRIISIYSVYNWENKHKLALGWLGGLGCCPF